MSNATKILGTSMIKATAIGKRFNQHKSISWSHRSRGNVLRTSTKIKQNTQVLIPRIIDWMLKKESFTNNSGILYPPRNNIAVIQLNNTIELYSALNLI
jgi:hypothetical protein